MKNPNLYVYEVNSSAKFSAKDAGFRFSPEIHNKSERMTEREERDRQKNLYTDTALNHKPTFERELIPEQIDGKIRFNSDNA